MTRAELDRAVRILPTSQLAALRLLLRKDRDDRQTRRRWWMAARDPITAVQRLLGSRVRILRRTGSRA